MATTETVNLIDCRHLIGKYPEFKTDKKAFKVKSMRNTIQYRIGDFLSEYEVNELILVDWIVNVNERMATK